MSLKTTTSTSLAGSLSSAGVALDTDTTSHSESFASSQTTSVSSPISAGMEFEDSKSSSHSSVGVSSSNSLSSINTSTSQSFGSTESISSNSSMAAEELAANATTHSEAMAYSHSTSASNSVKSSVASNPELAGMGFDDSKSSSHSSVGASISDSTSLSYGQAFETLSSAVESVTSGENPHASVSIQSAPDGKIISATYSEHSASGGPSQSISLNGSNGDITVSEVNSLSSSFENGDELETKTLSHTSSETISIDGSTNSSNFASVETSFTNEAGEVVTSSEARYDNGAVSQTVSSTSLESNAEGFTDKSVLSVTAVYEPDGSVVQYTSQANSTYKEQQFGALVGEASQGFSSLPPYDADSYATNSSTHTLTESYSNSSTMDVADIADIKASIDNSFREFEPQTSLASTVAQTTLASTADVRKSQENEAEADMEMGGGD